VADTLHFATHGPDGEIMGDYTTLPCAALCAEVAKVRISLRKGKLIEMPRQVALAASEATSAVGQSSLHLSLQAQEPTRITDKSWRSGRDLKTRRMIRCDVLCAAKARFGWPTERRASPSNMERHRCS